MHTAFPGAFSKQWVLDEPIRNVVKGCPDTCRATLIAPAFATTACSSSMHPVNYSDPRIPGAAAPDLYSEALIVDPFLDLAALTSS